MAQLVSQGYARHTGIGRTTATEVGLVKLEEMAKHHYGHTVADYERRLDHRRTTSKNRVVDRGESNRSSFGDRSAPTGRFRKEIQNNREPNARQDGWSR